MISSRVRSAVDATNRGNRAVERGYKSLLLSAINLMAGTTVACFEREEIVESQGIVALVYCWWGQRYAVVGR
jgi:hypothetical protein